MGDPWVPPGPDDHRPDFIVIGAMRAGTSALWIWLRDHPGTNLVTAKEPNLFVEMPDMRSAPWAGFFPPPDGGRTGESSVSYADPSVADLVAGRIAEHAPDAQLVYVVRHPVERTRSHHRHSYLRGRERRSITEAAVPGSRYVARSRYATVLETFRAHVDPARILVVVHEELVGGDDGPWLGLLDHLGLEHGPRPDEVHNATESKALVHPVARRYFDLGLDRVVRRLVPRRVRRLGADRLIRSSGGVEEARAAASGPLPESTMAVLRDETDRLEELLGRPTGWVLDGAS
ncbi:MAG: sulfotransferase [Actinomycetota bacterium]